MRIKNHYKNEIEFPGILKYKSKNKLAVKRLQEWINLWCSFSSSWYFKIAVDGDFGPITQRAVTLFQVTFSQYKLSKTGIVDEMTWRVLTSPMKNAFEGILPSPNSINEAIVLVGLNHLSSTPVELNNRNEGPWVRAYCDGNDGVSFPWCVGVTQTILDQAYNLFDRNYTDYFVKTLHCDPIGRQAKKNKTLYTHDFLRKQKECSISKYVKPGDTFNIYNPRKGMWVWSHQGLIAEVDGFVFTTIEGNSNDEGSRNGFELCQNFRDVRRQRIDIISTPELV